MPVWSISRPRIPFFVRQKRDFFAERNFFLAAKTKISCRKEIFRRLESGRKPGFGAVFSSGLAFSAYKIRLTFCAVSPFPPDAPPRVARTGGPLCRQEESPGGGAVTFCFSQAPPYSRIPAVSRPRVRPRDSREAAFDSLTECHGGKKRRQTLER